MPNCHTSDYSLQLQADTAIPDQEISFEVQPTVKVTFLPPEGERVTKVSFSPDPPTTGPTPRVGTDWIEFSNPDGATVDFVITVHHAVARERSGVDPLPIMTPTMAVFKPRTTCPPT